MEEFWGLLSILIILLDFLILISYPSIYYPDISILSQPLYSTQLIYEIIIIIFLLKMFGVIVGKCKISLFYQNFNNGQFTYYVITFRPTLP